MPRQSDVDGQSPAKGDAPALSRPKGERTMEAANKATMTRSLVIDNIEYGHF
ncbi:MAG: hypothetical protein ACREPR_20440 [Brasilonema sp.]